VLINGCVDPLLEAGTEISPRLTGFGCGFISAPMIFAATITTLARRRRTIAVRAAGRV
jgi:hypothetical protein